MVRKEKEKERRKDVAKDKEQENNNKISKIQTLEGIPRYEQDDSSSLFSFLDQFPTKPSLSSLSQIESSPKENSS